MPDPNNVILRDYSLAVFCIPKCGNTAVKYALAWSAGIDTSWFKVSRDIHLPTGVFEYGSKFAIDKCDGFLSVGTIRNPWIRVASCYIDKVILGRAGMVFAGGKPNSFAEFVDFIHDTPDEKANLHFRSQWSELAISDAEIVPDYLMQFEYINEDWKEFQKMAFRWSGFVVADLPEQPTANSTLYTDKDYR